MFTRSIYSEDYFTNCLQYLLEHIPNLGQSYLNLILEQAGLDKTEFLQSNDHPDMSYENRPDFSIEGKDFDIICEHKIESGLGDLQLQRYLRLAEQRNKKTFLILVSNKAQVIPQTVIESELYLHPSQSTHFYWRDFYSVFQGFDNHLCQDFAEYMAWFGMGSIELINGWDDLLTNADKGEEYKKICHAALYPYFKELGTRRCGRTGSYGYNVQFPTDWLSLMYLSIESAYGHEQGSTIPSPYIKAYIWIDEENPFLYAFQNVREEFFSPKGLAIWGNGRFTPQAARWQVQNGKPMCVATYYASLNKVLSEDHWEMQENILDFARSVFEHTQKTVDTFKAA